MSDHKEAKLKQFLAELTALTLKHGIIVEYRKECKITLFDCPEVIFGKYEITNSNGYWIDLWWSNK